MENVSLISKHSCAGSWKAISLISKHSPEADKNKVFEKNSKHSCAG